MYEEAGLKQYMKTLNLPDARIKFALGSNIFK